MKEHGLILALLAWFVLVSQEVAVGADISQVLDDNQVPSETRFEPDGYGPDNDARDGRKSSDQSTNTAREKRTRYGVGYEFRMKRLPRVERAQRSERPQRPTRPSRPGR